MKPPHKTPNKPLWIIGIVIVAIASYLLYNQWLHTADRQKFMTLKSDMLTLQQEFNRIDPGWQYSEACHAKGEKFKGDEASSCYVNLKNEASGLMLKKYLSLIDTASSSFGNIRDNSYADRFGNKNYGRLISFKKDIHVSCETSFSATKDSDRLGVVWFSCHDSALDFYFPKNQ